MRGKKGQAIIGHRITAPWLRCAEGCFDRSMWLSRFGLIIQESAKGFKQPESSSFMARVGPAMIKPHMHLSGNL